MEKIAEFFITYEEYFNIAIGAAVFIALCALRIPLTKAVLGITGRIFFNNKPDHRAAYKESLKKPVSIFFVILGAFIAVYINYRHTIVLNTFKILAILITCWCIVCYTSDNLNLLFNRHSENSTVNGVAVKFISNILKAIIICIALVMIISELGYNINGLLTGLGVGGLAVSLAAQDSLKNLISGFFIMFDKPFNVGDMIETSEFKGTVEDITMRSTRIRKLDDSIIVVPNSKLSETSITNYAMLTRKLVEFKVGLIYSTPAEVLKKCEKEIYDYLDSNEKADSETIRICFAEFEDSALNMLIRCYIDTTDIEEYYKFIEELNFKIKQIIENNKTDFAYPSRSIYIEKN